MTHDLVSIVVLNYNGKEFLKKCINSCLSQTYKNIEIVVVDNNSTDNSLSTLPQSKKIRVTKNSGNTGYAQGNNIGVRMAKGKFILILNNDTILYKDTVSVLVTSYKKNSILIPSQIIMSDKEIDSDGVCGAGIDIFGYGYHEMNKNNTKLFYADGAAIFLEKKVFIDLGGFDKTLFMFMEDIDLSWKAHLFGYHLLRVNRAKLLHYSGGVAKGGAKKTGTYITTNFRRYHNEKNIIRNILKNYKVPTVFILLPILFVLHFIEFLTLLACAKIDTAFCYPRAYFWNILNIKDTLKQRKLVQNKRVVGDLFVLRKSYFLYSKLSSLIRYGIPKIA